MLTQLESLLNAFRRVYLDALPRQCLHHWQPFTLHSKLLWCVYCADIEPHAYLRRFEQLSLTFWHLSNIAAHQSQADYAVWSMFWFASSVCCLINILR